MALEAEKRLCGCQQVVGNGTMGTVAFRAIIHEVSMFIGKGTLLISVALDADLMNRVLSQMMISETAVRVMTVCAGNFPLGHRMMTRKGELGLDFPVTPSAHCKGLGRAHDKIRSDMDAVTV